MIKTIDVSYNCDKRFNLFVNKKKYHVDFPEFDSFSLANTISNNLSLMYTYHLGLIQNKPIKYDTTIPQFQGQILKNILYDLPSCTTGDQNLTMGSLLKRFYNLKPEYSYPYVEYEQASYPYEANKDKVVLAFSFGKDSLLSLLLAQELGKEVQPVYIIEHSMKYEYKNKIRLIQDFEKEQNITTKILDNTISLLRDPEHLKCSPDEAELSWGTQNTQYSFMLLPYVRLHESSSILFGNEFTTNTLYYNDEGYEASPCFDQSSQWTNEISAMIGKITENKVNVSSYIEPFTDLLVMATLTNRYPEMIKYIMSCFGGQNERWCHACDICAKMYLMLVAVGIDPNLAGYNQDMLKGENAHFFSIFGGKSQYQYLNTITAHNEQLFNFELAYKRGNRSQLTIKAHELFQKEEKNFEELYDYFISFKNPISIKSKEIIDQLKGIYNETTENVFGKI